MSNICCVCFVLLCRLLILLAYPSYLSMLFSSFGNPGRSYDPTVDLTEALKDHYNPELAKQKLAEVHEWLNKDAKFTDEERAEKGWGRAYNLTTWGEFPGKKFVITSDSF